MRQEIAETEPEEAHVHALTAAGDRLAAALSGRCCCVGGLIGWAALPRRRRGGPGLARLPGQFPLLHLPGRRPGDLVGHRPRLQRQLAGLLERITYGGAGFALPSSLALLALCGWAAAPGRRGTARPSIRGSGWTPTVLFGRDLVALILFWGDGPLVSSPAGAAATAETWPAGWCWSSAWFSPFSASTW